MLNTSFISLTVFFFCTVCEYEFCTIIWNDTVSLFLYNLKVKRPLFSSLLQSNTYLFQVGIFICYSESCLYSLTEILDDWFRGVVTFLGKKNAVITLFRTKARNWFWHWWGWFYWHVAFALETRNLPLFQAFELFRYLIKSFSLHNFLTLTLIILIWYF